MVVAAAVNLHPVAGFVLLYPLWPDGDELLLTKEPVRMRGRMLCRTFRAMAAKTYSDITYGRMVGLVPGETTLTDNLLLKLATTHPREIFAHRFDQREEAQVGADWEWWFRDATGYAGVRVQAKRRNPGHRVFGLKQSVTGGHELQARRLHQQAKERGLTALYCLYSDIQPDGPPRLELIGPCPHRRKFDLTQWGCAVLLATTALRHAEQRRISYGGVLQDAHPLFHLVCDRDAEAVGSTAAPNALTGTVHGLLSRLALTEYHRPRQAGQDSEAGDAQELQRALVSGVDPPVDVQRAFEEHNAALVEARPGLAGVLLLDATT